MSLLWYGNQSPAESCNVGSLAVIAPLLERMNVARIINQHLPTDPQADYDHGTVLSLLIAARLYSPVALVNVAKWAQDAGADILWNIPPEKINDDRLGRSLDAFFTQRHSILASWALHVADEFVIPLSHFHYDPTHILFHGTYKGSKARGKLPRRNPPPSDGDLPPAHITKGRPLEDAPQGVRMIHGGLCTYVDELGPLPLFGHTVDGNQNGRTAVAEQQSLINKHLRPPELTMISDRGTYSIGHLARLAEDGYHAICSAPWGDFRDLYDQHKDQLTWKNASYLSLEQQRRRREGQLPKEHYELAVLRHHLTDPKTKKSFPVRVIFVFSTADEKAAHEQRQRHVRKIRTGLEQIQKSVAAGRRNTDPTSVARRVGKLMGNRQAANYFRYQMVPLSSKQRAALPKPQRGCRRPEYRFTFTFDQAACDRDEQYNGLSTLVTTVPPQQGSADALFTKFKQQTYSEHANHVFKGPLAVHPVYLKSPHRVEALVFLMMISLTIYFLLQRMYRETMEDDAPAKESRTTSQTILREFAVYTLLIHRTKYGREVQPTQLNGRQREILQRLGLSTPAQILCSRLARPPN